MQQNFISSALLSYSMRHGATHQRSYMKPSKPDSTPLVDSSLPLREQRNAKIRAEYTFMYTIEGKRNDVILNQLSAKYFLAVDTVERIVWQRGHYCARESQALAVA
jgi:hypothetical protein